MGQSLSWAAIDNADAIQLARILEVKRTGRFGRRGEWPLMARALPNGWYVVVAKSADDTITRSKMLAQLSKQTQLVSCSVEEHVMSSSCAFWKNGRKVWSVRHNAERGMLDLKSSGKPPASFSSLKQSALDAQRTAGGEDAEVDHIFDVPLQLAKEQAGFSHEESDDADYEIWDSGLAKRLWRATELWRILSMVVAGFVALGVVLTYAARFLMWMIFRVF